MSDLLRQLVQRCLGGEQVAMRQLVDQYRDKVFGLCFRMLGHRQDAEDAAQETFIRMLRSLSRWDSRRAFEPWLLAIAGNRCRTALAKRQRRPHTLSLVDSVAEGGPSNEQSRQLAEEIQCGVAELRREHRQAFLLFHEQHLGYAQIAEVMDRPVGTVKTWVHRARRQLIERLQARGVVEENHYAVR